MATASRSQMGNWRPSRASDLPKFAELVGDRVTLCPQPVGLSKPSAPGPPYPVLGFPGQLRAGQQNFANIMQILAHLCAENIPICGPSLSMFSIDLGR